MTKQVSDNAHVDLPSDVLIKAQGRARSLGMSLADYVRSLVDRDVDVASKEDDPWKEPIPPEVSAQWENEIAEFDAEEQRTGIPRRTYTTADEFINDMQDKT